MLRVSNSNAAMKFVQQQYFLSQNIGWDKRYCVPPDPHKLGRWRHAPLRKFLHTTEWGPAKMFQIGPALANTGPVDAFLPLLILVLFIPPLQNFHSSPVRVC